MKSLMPRFSRNTPEEAVVLNRKEMSALSSPWKVGKWRYDVSLSKNAAFQKFSEKNHEESSVSSGITHRTLSRTRLFILCSVWLWKLQRQATEWNAPLPFNKMTCSNTGWTFGMTSGHNSTKCVTEVTVLRQFNVEKFYLFKGIARLGRSHTTVAFCFLSLLSC